ncbi:MAG: FAD-dependent monooxygenase [Novosphingobium sp.]|nr:FAD-dependent monooxygenase [Novosphingobium sp.]
MSEVLILGGGLAGGAAATLLARSGTPVRLLERERGPHDKICGEFLSVEVRQDLERLGLDLPALGAVPIDRIRLASGQRSVETKLPFVALGLSRKVLDEALLELAAGSGATIERGVRVTGLGNREVTTSRGTVKADRILLATGKHDVRGAGRPRIDAQDGYVGFKMHWKLAPDQRDAMAGLIELVVHEGGYSGLQMVSADVLNLCLIVRRSFVNEAGGSWEGVLARLMREPQFARRLGDARPLMPRPMTIAGLPYGYVCKPDADLPEGVYRLGDQAAMTASLTGDGMAIALRTGILAAASLDGGLDARSYHRLVRQNVSRQVGRAMFLQRATENPMVMQAGIGIMKLWPSMLGTLAAGTRLPSERLPWTLENE